MWIVNPDVLAARIRDIEQVDLAEANLKAVIRIESWLDASIDVHKTIGVETVLSTDKYRRLVEKAKQAGFLVWMVCVVLDSPDRSIERIKLRVAKGGHHVPDDAVRSRYFRSLKQMQWFLDMADRAWIYDNSGAKPRQIGEKAEGTITLATDAVKHLVEALNSNEA